MEKEEKSTEKAFCNSPRSNGMYSVLKDRWIKKPTIDEIPEIDQNELDKTLAEWEDRYFTLIDNNPSVNEIIAFIEELYELRKTSIASDGEFGIGNLVFKQFRNLRYLDKLKDLKNEKRSDELSLESLKN